MTKQDVISYCLSFMGVYEDAPFHDDTIAIRCKKNKRIFALILNRNGEVWVNVKASPEWIDFWRNTYKSVVPGFHMNKSHWNSIILDKTIPKEQIELMIKESYALVAEKTN
ncbi:MAG: MmcQ/YjbR family DNA-binding protein [Oscillospiraceae bacterium]